MKKFTLSSGLLLTLFFGITNFSSSQTIILEQDGDQNEFVPADWTVQGGGFPNADQINITSGGSGQLALSNTDGYTNITVEVHFSQPNTINYDLRLFAGGSEADAELGNISDNTGADNISIVNFNNASPIVLDAIDFSNANLTVGITYLKITGTLDGTSSLDADDLGKFTISVDNGVLIVDSDVEGMVKIFNLNGQEVKSADLYEGENSIVPDRSEGIHVVLIYNRSGKILARKKVLF